jgi:hypothetical protein
MGLNSSVCRIWASHAALFFELWILIPRIVLWLATPYYHSSMVFYPLNLSFSACRAANSPE